MSVEVDGEDYDIVEKIEGDLFTTCIFCDPPQLIYKDKLGAHQALMHGRSLREVFEEEDRGEDEGEEEITFL